MAGLFGAIRRAAAPRAAVFIRLCSSSPSPSSRATDYKILLEKAEALEAEHEMIMEQHLRALDLLEKSTHSARDTVRETRTSTLLFQVGLAGLALGAVYLTMPESPSPTKTAAEAAKTTADAAKAAAEAAKMAAEMKTAS